MVTIEINGTKYESEEGKTVLEVAIKNNIKIPTLCYHKSLPAYGACRLCMVEIVGNGWSKITPSCTLPVKEGLKILTDSEKVHNSRKMTIELLLARCPDEKVLIKLAEEYGIKKPRFKKKDENCILCGLCVRMCESMGINAINFKARGKEREIVTPYDEKSDVCMTCGACEFVCPTSSFTYDKIEHNSGNKPVYIPSEFNAEMGPRHPIYIPFPQAVPKIPVIDQEKCVYYQTGKCKTCETFCEADAIVYDQKDEIKELDVGAIVVATGFDLFDPTSKTEYGYGKYNNVITGMEFERLVSASGPTQGDIEINGKVPKDVVFIQCVGSRDKEGNEYCSRVCCMYTAKQAHLVKEKIPDAKLDVFYTDVRAFGKGYEEFYNRVQGEGVTYRRRELDDPIKVTNKGEKLIIKAKGHPDIEADLVVLATGIVPRSDSKELSRILGINQSADGFLLEAHPKLRPVDTFTDGIFLAGCCQAPKDVPDTVAQASAAASRACDIISKKQLLIEATIANVNENLCRACGFCVDACPYTAIELKEIEKFGHKIKVARVNEILCKGCGSCSAACLNGAISHLGFTDGQILSLITALGGG